MLQKLHIHFIKYFCCFAIFAITPAFTEHIFSKQTIEQAQKANVLVAITTHFDPSRLQYLHKVLHSLSTFPRAHIIIVTNTCHKQDLLTLQDLCDSIFPNGAGGKTLSIRSYEHLAHPYDLAWCHKQIIADEFVKNNKNYSHFIYIEDDIEFNFDNFCYFVEFREPLRNSGLIPSYLRVEYRDAIEDFVNTDNLAPVMIFNQPRISFHPLIFLNMPNPYTACFVLDTELAEEYIATRSFNKDKSNFHHWNTRERAAMGLCFEHVPPSFQSRFAVLVETETGAAPHCTWVFHLPNNFANNQNTDFGKIRMNSLFVIQ